MNPFSAAGIEAARLSAAAMDEYINPFRIDSTVQHVRGTRETRAFYASQAVEQGQPAHERPVDIIKNAPAPRGAVHPHFDWRTAHALEQVRQDLSVHLSESLNFVQFNGVVMPGDFTMDHVLAVSEPYMHQLAHAVLADPAIVEAEAYLDHLNAIVSGAYDAWYGPHVPRAQEQVPEPDVQGAVAPMSTFQGPSTPEQAREIAIHNSLQQKQPTPGAVRVATTGPPATAPDQGAQAELNDMALRTGPNIGL